MRCFLSYSFIKGAVRNCAHSLPRPNPPIDRQEKSSLSTPTKKALHLPTPSYTQSIKKSHLPTLAYNQPKNVTLTRTYSQPVKNSHIHPHTSTPSTKKKKKKIWTHPHTSINGQKILLIHLHPLPAKICHIHPQSPTPRQKKLKLPQPSTSSKNCDTHSYPATPGCFTRNCVFPQNFHTKKLGKI